MSDLIGRQRESSVIKCDNLDETIRSTKTSRSAADMLWLVLRRLFVVGWTLNTYKKKIYIYIYALAHTVVYGYKKVERDKKFVSYIRGFW